MIEIVNNNTYKLVIRDLGVELQPGERIDLSIFDDKYIIKSYDIKSTDITFEQNGVEIDYIKVIRNIKKLSHFDHVVDDTIAHNVRHDYYFETEKENDVTKKITYYRDSAKTSIIREENIIRNSSGSVTQIISKIFDEQGNIVETETQNLNRTADGRVESITASLED